MARAKNEKVRARDRLFKTPTTRHGSFAMVQPHRAMALVSSAALHSLGDKAEKDKRHPDQAWQTISYDRSDEIGPLGYLLNLKANIVAACELRPLQLVADEDGKENWVPAGDTAVKRVMAAFVGPQGGQAELKRRAALHLVTAGETHVLGTSAGNLGEILWEFVSTDELRVQQDGTAYRKRDGMTREEIPADAYVARCWRSHPRFSDLSDSEVRRVLPICEKIVALDQMIQAVLDQRLAAGILYVPDEMSFADAADEEGEEEDEEGTEIDKFTKVLLTHMSAPKKDKKSAASLVPLVIRGPAAFADAIKLIEVARNLDTQFQDLRRELMTLLLQALDAPPEITSGKSSLNHWCVPAEVEILTENGWRRHHELMPGEIVLTLNHRTGLSEWQPIGSVQRFEVTDLPMARLRGRGHDSLSTMNHRWPVLRHVMHRKHETRAVHREIVRSENLRATDQLLLAAPGGQLPAVAKWDDALVEMVAWFFTEGTCRYVKAYPNSPPQVIIGQSHRANPDNVGRIRRALTALYGPEHQGPMSRSSDAPPAWRERREARGMTLFSLNKAAAAPLLEIAPDRVVSTDWVADLTASQLELFIDTAVRGDGSFRGSGRHIGQRDPRRLAAVELAAVLAGHTVRWAKRISGGLSTLGVQHMLHIGARPAAAVRRSIESYTGTIWCPTTPNGTWLARTNGTVHFTGNTAANVDTDFLSKHIVPLGRLLADFITVAYLRPMLEIFENMTPEQAATFKLDFDTSAVTSRVDEGGAARSMYDADLLNRKSTVRANGFDESDLPDADELFEKRVWKLVSAAPAVFAKALLPLIPGFEKIDVELLGQGGPLPGGEPNPLGVLGPDAGKPADAPVPSAGDAPGFGHLLLRVTATADMALERAVEKAASRLISRVGKDPSIRDRLSQASKLRGFTLIQPVEIERAGLTLDGLLEGEWDGLSSRTRAMVRDFLLGTGVDHYLADDAAVLAASTLCSELQAYVVENLHSGLPVQGDGSRVPQVLVVRALDQLLTPAG